MPEMHRLRATTITATKTYKGHDLVLDVDAKVVAVFDRYTDEPVAILERAEWTSPDRTQYRVEGVDGFGVHQIWQTGEVCRRCTPQMVLDTPDYLIPT